MPASLDQHGAREKCLRLLAVRARSTAELRDRLTRAGFPQEAIEPVLADLHRAGLVDDDEFARSWVASRQTAGAGRRKLRSELQLKGVAEDIIRQVVDESIDDETEARQAMDLARRRLRGREAEAETLSRLRRFLLGRGFGFETVDSVMRRLTSEVEC